MPAPPRPEDVLAQLVAFARRTAPILEQVSYWELLGLPAGAPIPDVRSAYYRMATGLHPDRYHALSDRDARDKLEAIYARVTEAYRVLSDPEKRTQYERALAEGKKRLVTVDRERKGPKNPEDVLKHPEAKKFFRLATIAMNSRDWKGAVLNLNFARSYEPAADILKEKLAEAQAQIKAAGAKPSG